MRFLRTAPNFDFLKVKRPAVLLSVAVIVIALGSVFVRGLELGIDFTGGTLLEMGYAEPVTLAPIRETLEKEGFGDAIVQHFGTARDVLINIPPRADITSADLSSNVLQVLRRDAQVSVEIRRVEFVGPQVGEELTEDGGLAVLISLICILIYVALRFEKRFAVGAVLALMHDVIITVGFFSLTGIEFDLPVLAAVLAVIGYSLNDTIVVFDRIRENFRKMRKGTPAEIVNASLNQTLSRTIVTGLTTLLVLIALFLFGGEIIHGFSLALIIGIVVGTYSSIYVASAAALALGITREDMLPPEKEGAELDTLP